MKYIKLVFAVFAILILNNIVAQHHHGGGGGYNGNHSESPKIGKILGTVVTNENAPLEYVSVAVLKAKDSTIVTGGVTNEKGYFMIDKLPFGKFFIQVKFIGYNKYVSEPFILSPKTAITKNFNVIQLSISENNIEELEVKIEKPIVSTSIDKKVFSADKNITSAGGTAVDVLNNVPSVAVDQDGNVSLRGNSNVTILIDGKPSGLTGGGRQALLEQIPASNIQDIEVITNPSAKYDPDGLSGIINIVLKKNKLKGTNGSISTSIGNNHKYNFNSQLSYRNEKWNVFANYSFNFRNFNMKNGSDRDLFLDSDVFSLLQTDIGTRRKISNMVKGGFDYSWNKKNTISLSTTYNINTHKHLKDILFENFLNDTLTELSERDTDEDALGNSIDVNLSHTKKGKKKGEELSTSINFSQGGRNSDGTFNSTFYDSTFVLLTDTNSIQENLRNNKNQIITAQMDYVKPINDSFKIETGWKVINRQLDNDFESITNNVSDVLLNNRLLYKETIMGAYLMANKKLSNKWYAQAGLRAEQANYGLNLTTNNEQFDSSYFSLYPSAYLKYSIMDSTRKTKDIVASYSRRINRPSVRNLNPFADYSNPTKFRRGNPYLQPEYIDSYELTYSQYAKGIAFNTSAYFKYTRNMISRVVDIDSNNISTVLWDNIGFRRTYGLEASLSGKVLPFMRIVLSGNAFRNETRGTVSNEEFDNDVNLDNDSYGFRGNFIANFKIKKKYDLQLTSWYRAPMLFALGKIRSMKSVDIALKRTFKKKFDVAVRFSDIFNTQIFRIVLDTDEYYSINYHKWESRNIYLNLSYRFGNQKGGGNRRGNKNKGNEGGFGGGGGVM